MTATPQPLACRDCGRAVRRRHQRPNGRPMHVGRGLCAGCWRRHRLDGTLADFERLTRPRDQLLADYRLLAAEGHDRAQIAARLGITVDGLDKALRRATATTTTTTAQPTALRRTA